MNTSHKPLSLNLRRVRTSIHSDVNTGSRKTQAAPPINYTSGTSKVTTLPAPPCGLVTNAPVPPAV